MYQNLKNKLLEGFQKEDNLNITVDNNIFTMKYDVDSYITNASTTIEFRFKKEMLLYAGVTVSGEETTEKQYHYKKNYKVKQARTFTFPMADLDQEIQKLSKVLGTPIETINCQCDQCKYFLKTLKKY
ncbi:hypothetical protein [Candidatus Phytoplasma meliae]|uniref:Uncharacterized protein n=1 Tax=Candidatus Phytoplasma meliae TaxID=1848402 RepID=A0ABS5CY32_9MOLU|nr:hypothetical protein [Candidatus Phytoplasma meliae]MBP5835894.1 hypothetical protein [Candidatus Phytoplasma meliae]